MQNWNSLWLNLIIMWSSTSHFTSQESALSSEPLDLPGNETEQKEHRTARGMGSTQSHYLWGRQTWTGPWTSPCSVSTENTGQTPSSTKVPTRVRLKGADASETRQTQLLHCQPPDWKHLCWSYLAPFPWKLPNSIFLQIAQISPISPLTSPLWRLLSQDYVNSPKTGLLSSTVHHTLNQLSYNTNLHAKFRARGFLTVRTEHTPLPQPRGPRQPPCSPGRNAMRQIIYLFTPKTRRPQLPVPLPWTFPTILPRSSLFSENQIILGWHPPTYSL